MFITERKFGFLKLVNVYFTDELGVADIPDYDVATYHTRKNLGDIHGYEKNTYLTTIIDLGQDIEVIWKRMKRQHKRHIRRAEKDGTRITMSNNYDEFSQIYKKFLKENRYSDPFGLNILSSQFMQKYGILFIAENHGEILGGNLYFQDKYNAFLVESIYMDRENSIENKKRSTDANCYLHWKSMQFFKNLGVIKYDLGEVSCDDEHIHRQMNGGEYFKRCFGGDVVYRYDYIKFNSRFYRFLWNVVQTHEYPARIN